MQNNVARRGEWGIKKYLLPNGSRPLLTSCSYRQAVEVISRDVEKNNKKASGKMEDEGRGGKKKDERKRKRERTDFGNVVVAIVVSVVIFYDEKTSLRANS